MKLMSALAALALSLASTLASAVPVTSCNTADLVGSYACAGRYEGNDIGNSSTIARTVARFDAIDSNDFSAWTLVDTTGAATGSQVALIYSSGGSSGSLLLVDPLGLLAHNYFGITLKAADYYSEFVFDGGALYNAGLLNNVGTGVTSLDFSTASTASNRQGIAQNLSHASLWGFTTSTTGNFGDSCGIGNDCNPLPVPEPSSMALTLAGLGMVGFIARRRKTA